MDNDYGIPDEENPEWTKADFARARRLDQLPGTTMHEKLQALKAEHERYWAERPDKTVIRLELSRDVVDGIQKHGADWQAKVDDALREWLANSNKAS